VCAHNVIVGVHLKEVLLALQTQEKTAEIAAGSDFSFAAFYSVYRSNFCSWMMQHVLILVFRNFCFASIQD